MRILNRLSFQTKLISIVCLACIICSSIAIIVAFFYKNLEFHSGLVEKSKIIHGRLNVATQYIAAQGGLDSIIKHYTEKYKDSSQLTEEDKQTILKQVPIYAAMKIGAQDAEKDLYTFRIFSNEPRNPKNKATEEELEIFKNFEKNSNSSEPKSSDKQLFIKISV